MCSGFTTQWNLLFISMWCLMFFSYATVISNIHKSIIVVNSLDTCFYRNVFEIIQKTCSTCFIGCKTTRLRVHKETPNPIKLLILISLFLERDSRYREKRFILRRCIADIAHNTTSVSWWILAGRTTVVCFLMSHQTVLVKCVTKA